MGLFSFLYYVLKSIQSFLMESWRVFFWNTRVLYSSETMMMVTPFLFGFLILWRWCGPDEQGTSIAHRGINDNMEYPDIVDESTYGGGGNFAGRKFKNPGAVELEQMRLNALKRTDNKKDR